MLCRRAVHVGSGTFFSERAISESGTTDEDCRDACGYLQNFDAKADCYKGTLEKLERLLRPRSERKAPRENAILLHADGCYIVKGEAITVSDNEDSVLQAFLENPAMDNTTLVERSGVELAGRVLRTLTDKYGGKLAPYITLPGRKGKGGYSVKIRRAQ